MSWIPVCNHPSYKLEHVSHVLNYISMETCDDPWKPQGFFLVEMWEFDINLPVFVLCITLPQVFVRKKSRRQVGIEIMSMRLFLCVNFTCDDV